MSARREQQKKKSGPDTVQTAVRGALAKVNTAVTEPTPSKRRFL